MVPSHRVFAAVGRALEKERLLPTVRSMESGALRARQTACAGQAESLGPGRLCACGREVSALGFAVADLLL